MKILNIVLADLIRRGKVTVDIPGLDMGELTRFLYSESAQTLREIESVVFAEEMTDGEKVAWIQERLM